MARAVAALSLLALASACSSESALTVDLRSDLAPGVEIAIARTTVTTGGRVVGMTSVDVVGDDLVRGARVGEVVGLAAGDYVVEVDALRPDGTLSEVRRVAVSLHGNYAVTVVISRDCAHLSCPGPHDVGTATECYHGRCVPPTCSDGTTTCGTPSCSIASDCAAPTASCAHAECLDHECWVVATAGACGSGEVCVPSTGCATVMHGDAGTTTDAAATPDAGADLGAPDASVADGSPACGSCNDHNGCTDDSCVGGTCRHTNNSAGCDDGNACTYGDTCSGGSCGGTTYNCDAPPCMTASCDGSGGCSIGGGCGSGTSCMGGACVACGGADQTCCGGSGCNAGLWCYTGVCTCAQPGGPCCPWDGSCAGGSTCMSGSCCMPIGASSSAGPCCPGLHNVSGICFG